MNRTIYIIDDEPSICVSLQLALKNLYRVKTFTSSLPALASMEAEGADIVLLDLRLGEENGLEVLERIKRIDPNTEVIMMTAFGSIDTSVNAMQKGAFTYLTKPINIEELKVIIQQAGNIRKLNEQIYYLSDQLESKSRFDAIIGESAPMQRVYMLIDRVKDIDTNVLITGESGTGKELVARAIHNAGKRYRERFVVVNCAAIPENLLEGLLFGTERGAYTGAERRAGLFEQADGGTLLLDELNSMNVNLQSKLLRVLQDGTFRRVGGSAEIRTNVRIFSNINIPPYQAIEEGKLRRDLFYRLGVVNISIPPLRERKDDIGMLAKTFIIQYNKSLVKNVKDINRATLECFQSYDWPGNVRELQHAIEHAMNILPDTMSAITPEYLPEQILTAARRSGGGYMHGRGNLLNSTVKDVEYQTVCQALQMCRGNISAAAKELGMSRQNLQYRIRRYQIDVKKFQHEQL